MFELQAMFYLRLNESQSNAFTADVADPGRDFQQFLLGVMNGNCAGGANGDPGCIRDEEAFHAYVAGVAIIFREKITFLFNTNRKAAIGSGVPAFVGV